MNEGNDITVIYKPKEETGKSFPETDILPRPKKTPVGDNKVMEAIKNQPDLTELFEEPSFEDLEAALQRFLNPETDESEEPESDDSDDDTSGSVVATKAAPAKASDFDRLFS